MTAMTGIEPLDRQSLIIYGRPNLVRPIMVMGFEGWADAGNVSSGVIGQLRDGLRVKKLAEINPDDFHIFQSLGVESRRPLTHVKDGTVKALSLTSMLFWFYKKEKSAHDLIISLGMEPELRWNEYADLVLDLAESARNAQQLRNVVTHRGIRLSGSQARRALDAIRFVLNVLRLPTSRPPEPFDYRSWAEHFGKASVDFPQLLDSDEGRLVVIRTRHENPPDPLTCWFQLERADNSFVVRIPEGVDEQVAAVLVVVTNDSYRYGGGHLPHLGVHAPPFLIRGLLDEVARTTTGAVHWAHAGMVRAQAGLSVQHACDYAVDSIWRGFTRLNHTVDSGDARFLPLCTRIASYLVHASAKAFQRFRQGMARSHHQISDEAAQVKDILTTMDPSDPHSMCDALRTIHRRTVWLDSIVVRCPLEHAEYGTRKRTLQ